MFRRLPKFEYFSPETVKEACTMLARYNGQAKVIAGGTGLVPQMKWRQVTPDYIIGLTNIQNLNNIEHSKSQGLKLGALTRLRTIEQSSVIRGKFPMLAQAASALGSIEIRNVATVGGNLCNASPAANIALPLLVLGATAKIVSDAGERVISMGEFFKGPHQTALGPEEILVELQVPNMPANSTGAYLKLGIRNSPLDRAVVAVATLTTLNLKTKTCEDAQIALGAVAPTPIRAGKAESSLIGKELNNRIIEEAADIASQEAQPITDILATAEYRKEMIKVLVSRAIKKSLS